MKIMMSLTNEYKTIKDLCFSYLENRIKVINEQIQLTEVKQQYLDTYVLYQTDNNEYLKYVKFQRLIALRSILYEQITDLRWYSWFKYNRQLIKQIFEYFNVLRNEYFKLNMYAVDKQLVYSKGCKFTLLHLEKSKLIYKELVYFLKWVNDRLYEKHI